MSSPKTDWLPLHSARSNLLLIWMIGGAIPFTILILQSIFGRYGSNLQSVWSWFLPSVMPNISLMIGVLGASALSGRGEKSRAVRRTYFNISRSLSGFYIVLLSLTILLEPLTKLRALELYTASNYWLSPLQGLVTAALGVLFVAQEPASRAKPEAS